jgi:hypothetical protein
MAAPKLAGVAATYVDALAALDQQAETLTAGSPAQAGTAVQRSEDFAAAMSDVLVPADAELAVGAIYADLQLAARLISFVPERGPGVQGIAEGFIGDLRDAVQKIRALIKGAPDPPPSGMQLADDLQPSYSKIIAKTADSLDKELEYLGITSLMEVLARVEELPEVGELVADVHRWIARILKTAVDKLVRLVGQTTASQVVQRVEDWLSKEFSVEAVTVEMVKDALGADTAVARLKKDIAGHPVSKSINDRAVVAVDALVASNGRIVDALDATAKVTEDAIAIAGETSLAPYVAAAKITVLALAALAALLIAIDDLDAWGDGTDTPILDTAGIPTLIETAIRND